MDNDEIETRLREAEEQLQRNAKNLGDLHRRKFKGKPANGLFAEGQFFRRLRDFCNIEIADIEGVIQDPDHYSR